MAFTAKDVQDLRTRTGAGMMDCKKALEEANGNLEAAAKILREKGIANAANKADRIAAEGVVESYIHLGGKIGVLVELNCETDFVARGELFKELCHNVAMHIAAANPLFVLASEVPTEILDKEREIYRVQAINEGKPEAVALKMVDGRVKKYYKEFCLMEQEYVKDPSKTITQLVNESIAAIGEKITIRRFTRYEMGEGLVKKSDNLADEVSKQMNK